jgi:DNA-binding LytR/AlgR family response regulator
VITKITPIKKANYMNYKSTILLYSHPNNRLNLLKKDIIRASGEINYTKFYLADGQQIVIAKTLNTFEEPLLQNQEFLRPNRSQIINQAFIKTCFFEGSFGTIVLIDGTEISIARRRLKVLKQVLKQAFNPSLFNIGAYQTGYK